VSRFLRQDACKMSDSDVYYLAISNSMYHFPTPPYSADGQCKRNQVRHFDFSSAYCEHSFSVFAALLSDWSPQATQKT